MPKQRNIPADCCVVKVSSDRQIILRLQDQGYHSSKYTKSIISNVLALCTIESAPGVGTSHLAV